MIELPEAVVLSGQIAETLVDKQIAQVTVLRSPHKFAWFLGEPETYPQRLRGKTVTGAEAHGGMVQIRLGDTSLVFHEGPSLRYLTDASSIPKKHQLLLEFTDSSFLSVSVQMYGGIICFDHDDWDNEYYHAARDRPSPLGEGFTRDYFDELCGMPGFAKHSAKAFLATDQRVPGLGNGVLQDVLFNARIHPKRKMGTVTDGELDELFSSIRTTLQTMVEAGGRDTEKNLFGEPGGYETILSRNTVNTPCPRCGDTIAKASYAGGSIYFCATCQALE